VFLTISGAILSLALIAGAIYFIKTYRPARVPVVERARVPHDVRAKVKTDARLRLQLLHQQRRAGRSRPPTSAPVSAAISAPVAPVGAPTTTPARPAPPPPDTHPLALVQHSLVHKRDGAPRPGSYFRTVEAPSQESIMSDVRGPWAAEIVTCDGRITLPDDGADMDFAWGGTG
jgi:hypothetical protein